MKISLSIYTYILEFPSMCHFSSEFVSMIKLRIDHFSLRKQPTFGDTTTGFPAK